MTGHVEFRTELIDQGLVLEVPNLDGGSGSGNQPVSVRREGEGVDDITSFKGIQVLGVVQVPKHDNAVLTSGSAEGTIGGDGDGVDVAVVANEVGAKLELGQVPDLDDLIPATRDDERVGWVGREADAGDPVAVAIFGELVLALTKGVPELDGLVTGAGDDLTVVGREGDGQNVVGVTDEAAGGGAGGEVPETEGLVPGGRKSKLTIRRDGKVLNEVVVAQQGLAGNTVVQLVTKYSHSCQFFYS